MRKVKFIFRVIASLLFLFNLSTGDITPHGSKFLPRCARLVNTEEFGGTIFIGYIQMVTDPGHLLYKINPDSCLIIGYKFNTLYILAVDSGYDLNRLDHEDFHNDPNVCWTNFGDNPEGGYIPKSDNRISEEIEYKIAGFTRNQIVIYMAKRTTTFRSKKPKTEIFAPPQTTGLRKVVRTGW